MASQVNNIVKCPFYPQCKKIDAEHDTYLTSLASSADPILAMVYGSDSNKIDVHQRHLGRVALDGIVQRLRAHWNDAMNLPFADFEELHEWVRTVIIAGQFMNAWLLNYDIALRIAYCYRKNLLPQTNIYLHADPLKAACHLAGLVGDKLGLKDNVVQEPFLPMIFDCGNCNPRLKEHVLCRLYEDAMKIKSWP